MIEGQTHTHGKIEIRGHGHYRKNYARLVFVSVKAQIFGFHQGIWPQWYGHSDMALDFRFTA